MESISGEEVATEKAKSREPSTGSMYNFFFLVLIEIKLDFLICDIRIKFLIT
jgi:hypothetical protein